MTPSGKSARKTVDEEFFFYGSGEEQASDAASAEPRKVAPSSTLCILDGDPPGSRVRCDAHSDFKKISVNIEML